MSIVDASATSVDVRSDVAARLARIEGQVRGVARMVDRDECCCDVLVQLSSVQHALRAVAVAIAEDALRHNGDESCPAVDARVLLKRLADL